MNRSFKVLSIAAYFYPSLRQFSNSISKKMTRLRRRSNFRFLRKKWTVTCQIVHPLKQPIIRRSNVRRIYYRGCDKTSHLSVSKYFFTTLATWDRALSWRRITLSCFCSYSSRFSRNARLKRINCSRYRSPVMETTRFQQLIVNKTLLVPPDTEHDLRTINVRAWC